jgi:hypothetical protein
MGDLPGETQVSVERRQQALAGMPQRVLFWLPLCLPTVVATQSAITSLQHSDRRCVQLMREVFQHPGHPKGRTAEQP